MTLDLERRSVLRAFGDDDDGDDGDDHDDDDDHGGNANAKFQPSPSSLISA